MVQEKLTSSIAKGVTFQQTKKEKETMAASVAPNSPNINKATPGGKYGAWGPFYKNKQNFIDMHYS